METELPYPKERLASESRAQQRWKPRSGGTAETEWAEMKQRLAHAEDEGRATRRLLLTLFSLGLAALIGINWLATTRLAAVMSERDTVKAPLQIADAQGRILLRVGAVTDRSQVRLFAPSGKPMTSWEGARESAGPIAARPAGTHSVSVASTQERQPDTTTGARKPAASPPAEKRAERTTGHEKSGGTVTPTIGTAARGPGAQGRPRSGSSPGKAGGATGREQHHLNTPPRRQSTSSLRVPRSRAKRAGDKHWQAYMASGDKAREKGRCDRAVKLYWEPLKAAERSGQQDRSFVAIYTHLGLAFSKQGKYVEAESLYQRVLAMGEKSPELEHAHRASCLSNLAALYYRQGKYA